MPCGTGKTITILSFLIAYKRKHPHIINKIVYCTRTVPELTKAMEELRDLIAYYEKDGSPLQVMAMSLSARSSLCINPAVASCGSRMEIDSACRARTAGFVRKQNRDSPRPDQEYLVVIFLIIRILAEISSSGFSKISQFF